MVAPLYVDWNATSPPHPAVVERMAAVAADGWANPASVHGSGRRARAIVEDTREATAAVLGVHPRDVLFTASGTEANNLALAGAGALILTRLEHPSITMVASAAADAGTPVTWLPVTPAGVLDLDALEEALRAAPPRSVVALMAANHETGVRQPVAAAAEMVRQHGHRLHVDAVQAFGRLGPEAWAGAHSVTVCGHKVRGPKGIGVLAFEAGWTPVPVLRGGAQERGLRPGTQDAAVIAGLRVALDGLDDLREGWAGVAPLRDAFEAFAEARGAIVNGSGGRLPHTSNLSLPGWNGDEAVAALDLLGIHLSSGSACTAGTAEPSAVVAAMVGHERARRALRISLGPHFDEGDLQRLLGGLLEAGVLPENSPEVAS